jgi:beta-N-acetylglucosaminidase
MKTNQDIEDLKKEKEDLEKENQELRKEIDGLKSKEASAKEADASTPALNVSWNPNDVSNPSNISSKKLNELLSDTGLKGLGDSFVEAEKEYGVNAIFLTSLVAQESGWGTSNRAINHNNLSGYAVYTDASKGKFFTSKHESIMTTARLIRDDYMDADGRHDIRSINEKYTPVNGYDWSNKISLIANDLKEDARKEG